MTSRTYYVPFNAEAKIVINAIAHKVPCFISVPEVSRRINMVKFSVNCRQEDIAAVEQVLVRYGFL